ncbi:alpha-amylase [Methanocella sp. CWC-04]|uniref:Alpha-amylase n=1 Tax=Methanooceanicella nereidis TaxID=2052831 RepID=A0AAP2RA78_9EURY|nr:glycoside hydrolase family 57 protein [Methanocella sp. CWC-04]MCD1293763.1 alpha-amylase [Methanocella sp. CWC-04]
MTSVCLYFQVHQPNRLKWFFPGIDKVKMDYFNDRFNEEVFRKVAKKCYWPATKTIFHLLKRHEGKFKVTYSLSGIFLDQCEKYDPELIDLFRKLLDTGCVEFLDETYYHSLVSLFEDKKEFVEQIKIHREAMESIFGYRPTSFRNTELIYSNEIASTVDGLGYKSILMEGIESVLGWRSPNYVYRAKKGDIRVLARNYPLSDDIAFRFSANWWNEYPLTADKWAKWARASGGDIVNIFMDYETFGEHQWEESGIFWFLKALPDMVLNEKMRFATVTENSKKYGPKDIIDVPDDRPVSWADLERDTSAWLGNDMQRRCFEEGMLLGNYVKLTGDARMLEAWRNLLTSDNIYYICTKWLGDGDVHSYFSHHSSPFDAGVNYAAILSDFKGHIFEKLKKSPGGPLP